jgi:hypothetical protein
VFSLVIANGDMIRIQRWCQSLEKVAIYMYMARSHCGFGQDAGGAGDKCLHAGYTYQISRIRIGGQCAVRLNLPGGQGCFQPYGLRPQATDEALSGHHRRSRAVSRTPSRFQDAMCHTPLCIAGHSQLPT